MTLKKDVRDRWQCAQLVSRFFYYLDEFRYDDLLNLMLEEATWFRQGELLRGRAQISKTLSGRSRTQRIRHVITNTVIDSTEPGKASGTAYLTVYKFDDGSEHKKPPTIDGAFRLSLVQVQFAETEAQWRLAAVRVETQFDISARDSGAATAAAKAEPAGKQK